MTFYVISCRINSRDPQDSVTNAYIDGKPTFGDSSFGYYSTFKDMESVCQAFDLERIPEKLYLLRHNGYYNYRIVAWEMP